MCEHRSKQFISTNGMQRKACLFSFFNEDELLTSFDSVFMQRILRAMNKNVDVDLCKYMVSSLKVKYLAEVT